MGRSRSSEQAVAPGLALLASAAAKAPHINLLPESRYGDAHVGSSQSGPTPLANGLISNRSPSEVDDAQTVLSEIQRALGGLGHPQGNHLLQNLKGLLQQSGHGDYRGGSLARSSQPRWLSGLRRSRVHSL